MGMVISLIVIRVVAAENALDTKLEFLRVASPLRHEGFVMGDLLCHWGKEAEVGEWQAILITVLR